MHCYSYLKQIEPFTNLSFSLNKLSDQLSLILTRRTFPGESKNCFAFELFYSLWTKFKVLKQTQQASVMKMRYLVTSMKHEEEFKEAPRISVLSEKLLLSEFWLSNGGIFNVCTFLYIFNFFLEYLFFFFFGHTLSSLEYVFFLCNSIHLILPSMQIYLYWVIFFVISSLKDMAIQSTKQV